MPQYRHLSAMAVMVAALLLAFSSVASAHPGHRFWASRFDNIWRNTEGLDAFTAAPGDRDLIIGLGGDDTLDAGDRRDVVVGGPGNDTITGGDQNDRLVGGPGDDIIEGGDGRDVIRAGRGDDTVLAADGRRDWVRCGLGEDEYTADRFDRVARNCETELPPEDDDTP
jgi:hypothetical protein